MNSQLFLMIPPETRHKMKIDFFRLLFRKKYALSITKDEELTLTPRKYAVHFLLFTC